MVRRHTSRLTLLWVLIPFVVLLELLLGWSIPRKEPTTEDWQAAARALEQEKKAGDLVVIAPAWVTQGRLYFGHLMSFKDFGHFDTTTYNRIFEVALGGARAPETEGLKADSVERFGRIRVSRFTLQSTARVLYDFVDKIQTAKGGGSRKMGQRIVIDHWFNPRWVIPVKLTKQGASLTYENVPFGGVLRGYGIIGYRSGRFNRGGPVVMTIFANEQAIGEWRIRNFGPRDPFRFELPVLESGQIRFEFKARDHLEREFGFAADIREEPPGGGAR